MRRPSPWIHRWSRPLIGAIATTGTSVTAYLSLTHLLGQSVACPTQGCEVVLNSAYSNLFGIPLALLGCLAYAGMALLAWGPLLVSGTTQPQQRQTLEDQSWGLLLVGSTMLLVFSGYLMTVLVSQLQVFCFYCVISALCSVSLFGLTLQGRDWPDLGQVSFRAMLVGLLTLVATVGLFAVDQPGAIARQSQLTSATTSVPSGPAELALAAHLQQTGAKMYGAYWCSHCQDQKHLFGEAAFKQITYIECDAQAAQGQPELCQAAGIKGFPTWEIQGQQYSGTRALAELADLSGYQGPRNFVIADQE